MKQRVVAPAQGPDYDWSPGHISVKTPVELTDGRVSVVEDLLKPRPYARRDNVGRSTHSTAQPFASPFGAISQPP